MRRCSRVVVRVRHLLEQRLAEDHQLGRRIVEEPPDRERDGEVVHDRGPPEQRSALQRHRRGTGEGVPLVLARGEHELALEAAGQGQHVALVRSLVAERVAAGLAEAELAGAVASHGSGRRGGEV